MASCPTYTSPPITGLADRHPELNAFAALLVSPISWTHHWVWAEPALLVLAVLTRRYSWRAGLAAAVAGLVIFAMSPAWLPSPVGDASLRWAPWEQLPASSYVIFAAGVLLLSAFGSYRDRPELAAGTALEQGSARPALGRCWDLLRGVG